MTACACCSNAHMSFFNLTRHCTFGRSKQYTRNSAKKRWKKTPSGSPSIGNARFGRLTDSHWAQQMLGLHLPLRRAAADLVGERDGDGIVHAAPPRHVALAQFQVEVLGEPGCVEVDVVAQEAEQFAAGQA